MNNLDRLFAVPVLWLPEQSHEEFLSEVHSMMQRAIAVRDLLEGEITLEDYADLLNDQSFDVSLISQGWSDSLERIQ